MVPTRHNNRKFCLSKRPRKFKHFVCYLRRRRKKIFSFRVQIAVQRNYFIVCNVLMFFGMPKCWRAKGCSCPPQKMRGAMLPLPPPVAFAPWARRKMVDFLVSNHFEWFWDYSVWSCPSVPPSVRVSVDKHCTHISS